MMKYGLKWMLLAAAGILLSAQRSEAQTYVKLNGLYALVVFFFFFNYSYLCSAL